MITSVHCNSCGSENPFYRVTCSNCKSYLRDKVYNLNLFQILSLLIENPLKAFKLIIFSEQKNFIIFILFFSAIKHLINIRFISMITLGRFNTETTLLLSFAVVFGCLVLFVILSAVLFTLFCKVLEIETRFKDNFAIITYPQIFYVLALIFLFPIELILFGDYLFSINPTPCQIKGLFAYILFSLESLVIVWSSILLAVGFYTQLKNVAASILSMLLYVICFIFLVTGLSYLIFTI